MLAVLVVAVTAGARAQTYVVAGGCRDGVPSGAYELRMPDGQLRVAGAFAKGRRTGTFLFWTSTGARIAVIPYEDDVKIGTVAVWYAPSSPGGEPRRKLESAYAGGLLHGTTRSWHANGRLRAEYRYEHGQLGMAQAWSRSGAPLSEAAARRQADLDRADDARFYEGLERSIGDHAPRCE